MYGNFSALLKMSNASDNDDDDTYHEFQYDYAYDENTSDYVRDEDVPNVILHTNEIDRKMKEALEIERMTKRTIGQDERKFCFENGLVYVVIPGPRMFDRFFISHIFFPSSLFYGRKVPDWHNIVPEEYDSDTAYLCRPDDKGLYINTLPVDKVMEIIYPSATKKRAIEREKRNKERALRKPDPELDAMDLALDKRDAELDEKDLEIRCAICCESDAQIRCMTINCGGYYCEVCYNRLRFHREGYNHCMLCRRYF